MIRDPQLVREMMLRARRWQHTAWVDKCRLAGQELHRMMGYRGYPGHAKPRVRVFHTKTGKPLYVVRLVNQGRERRKNVHIAAQRWDTLMQKLFFRQWSLYPGSRYERRWK